MWHAWIGDNYHAQGSLLLLGESCYSWVDEHGEEMHPAQDHPVQVVNLAINNPLDHVRPFFVKVSRALCQIIDPTQEQSAIAWNEIAFTNYVPETVGIGNPRPTSSQWAKAALEWPLIIDTLMPANVIVLGKTTWNNLPVPQRPINAKRKGYEFGRGQVVWCHQINHPRVISWAYLAQFISKVRANEN